MKKQFLTAALLFILLHSGFQSRADHLLGMDMTYKCSGTNDSIFKITVVLYRDCRGCYLLGQSPKCGTSENCNSSGTVPTSLALTCIPSGSSLGTISMSRTGISDITGTCKKDISKCTQPCNGSYPFGIEKHVFEGTLDLRSQMKKGCCRFRLASTLCCRNVSITTGPSGGFYTYLDIDACTALCNSSPQFTNDPIEILCCNNPSFYNIGAHDADHDSLSYSLESAYSSPGTKSNYTSPYSATYPMKAYFTGSNTPPYSNPTTNPPMGIFFDKNNGDFIFNPMDCSQEGVVVTQIDKWRKDSKGVYQKIGTVRRDITLIVANCPLDNPPKITNKTYTYSVCEGNKLCFDITTEDKVYVPPPPAKTPAPDTVILTWNNGIADASFTIKDPNAREQTASFCWSPKSGTASDIPYTFTVRATSNSCPLMASAIRSFTIKVNQSARTKVKISKLACNNYKVESSPLSGIKAPATYDWQVIDSFGKLVNDTLAWFGSGKNRSSKSTDTVFVKNAGKYSLMHTINDARNCPVVYFDTLIVPELLDITGILGSDTNVCAGTLVDITANVKSGVPAYKYQWYTPAKNIKDTLATFRLITFNRDTVIHIQISDDNGCVKYDTVKISVFAMPIVNLGNDKELCQGDSVQLDAGNFSSYKWNTGNTTKSITVKTTETYKVNVTDGNGCKGSDSIGVKVLPLPKVNLGNDTSVCQGDSVKLDAGIFATYKWNNGTSARSIFAKTQGKYKVNITDSKGCKGSDSIFVTVFALPKPNLGRDTSVCQGDSVSLNPGLFSTYKWNTGQTSQIVRAKIQGKYKVTVSDGKGCKGSDSAILSIIPLPTINLGKDTTICIGDSLKLDAGNFSSYEWNNGKTSRNITVKTQASYYVEVTNTQGCKNSDAIFVTFIKCSNSAGLSTLKNVKLFPNPASDILTIEFYNSGDLAQISISDLNGRILLKKQTSRKGFVSEELNIKTFERGYYIVDIKTEEGSFSGKVLVK